MKIADIIISTDFVTTPDCITCLVSRDQSNAENMLLNPPQLIMSGLILSDNGIPDLNSISENIVSCLKEAEDSGYRAIDICSISGAFDDVFLFSLASASMRAVHNFSAKNSLKFVRMVCHTEKEAKLYSQVYNFWFAGEKSERIMLEEDKE